MLTLVPDWPVLTIESVMVLWMIYSWYHLKIIKWHKRNEIANTSHAVNTCALRIP